MEHKLSVPLVPVLSLLAFSSEDEMRRSLYQRVFIDQGKDGGVILGATDGHALGLYFDKDGYCPPEGYNLTPDKAWKTHCKGAVGASARLVIAADGGLEIQTKQAQTLSRLVRDQFLTARDVHDRTWDFRSVIPTNMEDAVAGLSDNANLSYASRLLDKARFGRSVKKSNLTFWRVPDRREKELKYSDIIIVVNNQEPNFLMIMMPMKRDAGADCEIPGWAKSCAFQRSAESEEKAAESRAA